MNINLRVIFLAPLFLMGTSAHAQVNFVELLNATPYTGKTFGASWGDLNADGLPDLYLSCHQNTGETLYTNDSARVFINLGNGNFTDSAYWLEDENQNDVHGALIIDVDNNGVAEVVSLSGDGNSNAVLVRNAQDALYEDVAPSVGLTGDGGRGRTPMAWDVNGDGTNDFLFNNLADNNPEGSSRLYISQLDGDFSEQNAAFGLDIARSTASVPVHLDNSGVPILVVMENSLTLYRLENGSFTQVGELQAPRIKDFCTGDFNGDGLIDLVALSGVNNTEIVQHAGNAIRSVHYNYPQLGPSSFTFELEANAQLAIQTRNANDTYTLHRGPSQVLEDQSGNTEFVLNTNQWPEGIQSPQPGEEGLHIYIGRLSGNTWQVICNNTSSSGSTVGITAQSQSAVTLTEVEGILDDSEFTRLRLFLNEGDLSFTEVPLLEDINGRSVVAADFDNDGDLDLYALQTGDAANKPNILLLNNGSGSFVPALDTGAEAGEVGIGESATVTDFNSDGFADLFVTNGNNVFYLDSARVQLFENQGNGNNWLGAALVGIESAADPVGALVYFYSNGEMQLRQHTAGVHVFSQNDPRIHFGLGAGQQVDSLVVEWPSGQRDVHTNLSPNQYHTLVEGTVSLTDVQEIELSVHPNPVRKSQTLHLSAPIRGTLHVYNSSGQRVLSRTINRAGIDTRLRLPASGLYLLQLVPKSSAAQVLTYKIVVQ